MTIDEMISKLHAANAEMGGDAETQMVDQIILELHMARVDLGGDAEAVLVCNDKDEYVQLYAPIGTSRAVWKDLVTDDATG